MRAYAGGVLRYRMDAQLGRWEKIEMSLPVWKIGPIFPSSTTQRSLLHHVFVPTCILNV